MNRTEEVINSLAEFIEPKCELNFNNNYELICAVMLSAQTTDKRVNEITPELFKKYPNFESLMEASKKELKEIINPLGLSNVKSNSLIELSKMMVSKYAGEVPSSMEELLTLPGIGRKTANVVLGLGFKIPSVAVDTHVKRVSTRLKISSKTNVDDIEEDIKKKLPKTRWIDAHHLLLLFGRYYCKASKPLCENCKMKKYCKLG